MKMKIKPFLGSNSRDGVVVCPAGLIFLPAEKVSQKEEARKWDIEL